MCICVFHMETENGKCDLRFEKKRISIIHKKQFFHDEFTESADTEKNKIKRGTDDRAK